MRARLARLASLVVLALAGALARASDDPTAGDVYGYARTGQGGGDGAGRQQCFGLPGLPSYRLGNECDSYAALGHQGQWLSQGDVVFGTKVAASAYRAHAPGAVTTTAIDEAMLSLAWPQAGTPTTVWLGRRYFHHPEVHILDAKFVNMDGTGIGLDLGALSYAFFVSNLDGQRRADRHNLVWRGVPLGDALLDLYGSQVRDRRSARQGSSVSAVLRRTWDTGSEHRLVVQLAHGPAIAADRFSLGSSGDAPPGRRQRRARLINDLYWQPDAAWGISAVALAQQDRTADGARRRWLSAGVRAVRLLGPRWRLLIETGVDEARLSGLEGAARLAKITVAPAWALVPGGVWSRPEWRLFATAARWNRPAQSWASRVVPGSSLSDSGLNGESRQAWTLGVQIETWF